MTHNIIHDEVKLDEVIDRIVDFNGNSQGDVRGTIKQYAEHYLIKHIDSEIERLRTLREYVTEKTKDRIVKTGYNLAIVEQIEHQKSLKAELTKSK